MGSDSRAVLEQRCREELLDTLRGLSGIDTVEVRPLVPGDERSPDLLLRLRGKGSSALVCVEYRTRGYPREVREAARLARSKKRRAIPMVVAPSLSPGARELLRASGVGYWDSGGSLYLELPWALYHFERPAPPMPTENRTPRHPFEGKTAQAIHALLLEPGREWKVQQLAQAADVSSYTAQQVLVFLEEQLWVQREGRGPATLRRLVAPGKLLDAWADNHSLSTYRTYRFHRLAMSLSEQETALDIFLKSQDCPWALTLEHGADRVAPFLTALPATLSVLVPGDRSWSELASAAGFREVDEGENFRFLATEKACLLGRQRVDEMWVASPIQLYLDLMASPRRGKEQAAHLRSKLLEY